MATDGHMATATDESAVLTLAQWFSPAYPVGSFHFSHGLEWAITAGDVTDAGALGRWVKALLEHGAGWNDTLLLAAASRAGSDDDELYEINDIALALTASRERRIETVEMGAAFARVTSALRGEDLPRLAYPVAIGHAARRFDLPPLLAAQLYLQAFVGNLAAVGMRLVPLGQTEGQAIIHVLAPLCQQVAARTAHGNLDALTSTVFRADIAAMKHETQYSRIFRT